MVNLGETLQEEIFRRKARAIHMKKLKEIRYRSMTRRNKNNSNSFSFNDFQKKRKKFMKKEKFDDLNKSNRILLQRLIAISNRKKKNDDGSNCFNKPQKMQKLIISSVRRQRCSPVGNSYNSKVPNLKVQNLIENSALSKPKKKRSKSRDRCAQRYFRDQVIASKFTCRYNQLRRIEVENAKFAKRLYDNKPSISKKKLEDSFQTHLKLKKRMSKFSQNRARKSIAMEIANRKLGTSNQVKRSLVPGSNSVPRMRPKTRQISTTEGNGKNLDL
ncbi:unnamed protein product [Moneuplotes crassus]|uniref:Uncharacterized protein n=1 Tax=Euplotes crassus TaxID=5936 RepID=A0AAD1XND6_EUPCR|nr:unnamed protein product [Moneuplotes crassus]